MPFNKEQQKKYVKKHYQDNKDKYQEALKRGRRKMRMWLDELKTSKPCMDCNLFWPPYVMEFDHRDASTKLGTIAALCKRASKQRVLDEIAKCDLVCSNCHQIRTHKRLHGLL